MDKQVLLNEDGIDRCMRRIAHEILERTACPEDLSLVGIRTRGVSLANRLSREIAAIIGYQPLLGSLDITLYRDDIEERSKEPLVKPTELPFSIEEKIVVLIDDVLFTGRTIRAAMDTLLDFGRPKVIRLAVLIDRGHMELPIRPDYVGKNVVTNRQDTVKVLLKENDGLDEVVLFK